MKTLIKLVFISLILVSFSCTDEPSEESKAFDEKMKQTIQIHDDVMPKMSRINNVISELEAEKEVIVNDIDTEIYDKAISELKEAHDLMMSWMKNFSNSFSRAEINQGLETQNKDSIAAKLDRLDIQYKSAEEMKNAINSALENAQKLLAK